MPTIVSAALSTGRPPPAPLSRAPCDLRVVVRYEQGSWQVCGPGLEPMMFTCGQPAERAGRRLAACLARLGDDVRLELHDCGGGLVAHIRVFADEAQDASPGDCDA